ncbi:hypothetical protein BC826DRAFT_1104466 [Russula brevipes]|nr:hypothetical protein BC826DRAFT_1104466 [Russula brevipes]
MSPARRRNTVHDFSTLRLHPDGTRVSITSPTRTGLYRSRTRNTGYDTRGNRVALDAAGIGTIPKRTVMCEDDNGEDIPVGPGVSDDEVQSGSKPRVPRRRKRRRLDTDVEFLGDPGTDARRAGVDGGGGGGGGANADTNIEAMSLPMPSSDLLKCVHHFTSHYYAARGLLSDQSRRSRRESRQRKARVVRAADSDAEAEPDADDLFAEDEEEEGAGDYYFGMGDGHGHEEGIVTDTERVEGNGAPPESVSDMYKAFDGSALMAIGTRLECLKPNILSVWEEEMEVAGLVPGVEGAIPDRKDTEDAESDKSDNEQHLIESSSSDKG